MWIGDDDDYQENERCDRMLKFKRCCICIAIPTAVKILAVFDVILFLWLSLILIEGKY